MASAAHVRPDNGFRPLHREKWLAIVANRIKDKPMEREEALIEEKVLKQLVEDIGLENTKRFMESLDNEFQKRITNIRSARDEASFAALAAQAHALKSSAQVSGALKLSEVLNKLEHSANLQNNDAFALAQEALTIAEMTRFAFLDVKLAE